MTAYDNWKTTDPAIEAACEECGCDTRFDDHEDGCSEGHGEPNFEAMCEPEEEDPRR